jgi:prefoldin subunit 5
MEMTDFSPYYNQMNQIDQDIEKYNTAKTALSNAKTEYQGSLDTLNTSKGKFDSDVPDIKENDVFEGEMADSLKEKVSTAKGFINTAGEKAATVITEIDAGIAAIDVMITNLGNLRTEVNNQLIAAIETVNAANQQ